MRPIDADKLKNSYGWWEGNSRQLTRDEVRHYFDAMIDAQPTAETIKHGRWIEHHEPFSWMGFTTWTCSECDYEVGYEKDIKNITNYCPKCGAKMDEVEE